MTTDAADRPTPTGVADTRRLVIDFAFTEFGCVIGYVTIPDDMRKGGSLAAQHQIAVKASDSDYTDVIGDIKDAVHALLEDVLEDFHSTPPHVEDGDEDGDEDAGMGDG